MRVLIQRVLKSELVIENKVYALIENGLLVFLGIEDSDGAEDVEWLCNKIINLRIFNDDRSVMNKSVLEIGGEILLVSQFTLHASTKKGNRPSYIRAARPETATPLYNKMISVLKQSIPDKIKTGVFGADMKISLINDGPVTIFIDSKNRE
ncbi:MAG TPA: D-aminoacyl-tRNA deacylase [Bacteroidia bacterium]|nr:D-aminoacyl-tRNA deacylase [Bacteroidia bacterium]HNU34621.1 D-aminoacyl-tRNA deacylase [Bacteroidia bacterium]